jgi:hypothetical protein
MFKLNVGMVLGTLLLAAPAWSSLIVVNNFSFEASLVSPTSTGFGPYTLNIPSWITTGTAGTFQPNTNPVGPFALNAGSPVPTGPTGVPDGVQVGFLQFGGSIFQDLTPIAGTGSYQVSVDVGHRTDVVSGAYTISLSTSGGTPLASFTGDISSIASGAWARETVTFEGAPIPVGQSLRLTLSAPGGQVAFDNVEAYTAPEIGGSAVFWTMFGVAGFWIYRKKRSVA